MRVSLFVKYRELEVWIFKDWMNGPTRGTVDCCLNSIERSNVIFCAWRIAQLLVCLSGF